MGQASGYYSLSADNTTPDFPYVYDELGEGSSRSSPYRQRWGERRPPASTTRSRSAASTSTAAGVNHGFLLNFGLLVTLDAPGSTFTQALGLNNKGQVVGDYMDVDGNTHGFVWTSKGGFTDHRRSRWRRHHHRQRHQRPGRSRRLLRHGAYQRRLLRFPSLTATALRGDNVPVLTTNRTGIFSSRARRVTYGGASSNPYALA